MLRLSFAPRTQRATLAAAGADIASIRAAGFQWESPEWVAPDTAQARALYDAVRYVQLAEEHAGDAAPGGNRTRIVVCRTACTCDDCQRPIGVSEEMMLRQDFTGNGIESTRLCCLCYGYALAGAP